MSDLLIFSIMPTWLMYSFVFIFGAIIGSFLDVVITRFHTGASLNGRSRCLSCGKTLSWYELMPCVSYLMLRGRCHSCKAHIPVRLLLMEVLTGGLFVLVFSLATSFGSLAVSLALVSLLVVITVYDIEHMLIPNEFVVSTSVLVLLVWLVELGGLPSLQITLMMLLSAVGCFAFYASLWLYSKGRWIGFGDAKLALPLGFLLGPAGAASFVIFSFWIGAVVSVSLLLGQYVLRRGQKHLAFLQVPLTMKSEVPFAPFMIVAFILVYLFKADVLNFMSVLMYGSL